MQKGVLLFEKEYNKSRHPGKICKIMLTDIFSFDIYYFLLYTQMSMDPKDERICPANEVSSGQTG